MSNEDKWSPTRPSIPRQRVAGEEVWRLHDHTGQTLTCEVFNETEVGAGFDVLMLLNEEPHMSRRCADADTAKYIAEAWRQDNLRGGWTEGSAPTR